MPESEPQRANAVQLVGLCDLCKAVQYIEVCKRASKDSVQAHSSTAKGNYRSESAV